MRSIEDIKLDIKKLQVELEEAKTATIKEEYSKLNGKWIKIIHAAYDYNPPPEELDRYQVSYALIDAIDCVNEITSDCNSICAKVLIEIKIFNNTIFNHKVKDKDFTPTVEFYSNHYIELHKEDVINELDAYNTKYTEYVSGIKDLINTDLNTREVPNLGVIHEQGLQKPYFYYIYFIFQKGRYKCRIGHM